MSLSFLVKTGHRWSLHCSNIDAANARLSKIWALNKICTSKKIIVLKHQVLLRLIKSTFLLHSTGRQSADLYTGSMQLLVPRFRSVNGSNYLIPVLRTIALRPIHERFVCCFRAVLCVKSCSRLRLEDSQRLRQQNFSGNIILCWESLSNGLFWSKYGTCGMKATSLGFLADDDDILIALLSLCDSLHNTIQGRRRSRLPMDEFAAYLFMKMRIMTLWQWGASFFNSSKLSSNIDSQSTMYSRGNTMLYRHSLSGKAHSGQNLSDMEDTSLPHLNCKPISFYISPRRSSAYTTRGTVTSVE